MRLQAAAFLVLTAALGSTVLPSAACALTTPAAPAPMGGKAPTAAYGNAEQDFTIVNNTGHTVTALNVSPSNERVWGPNILGSDTIANGESAQINFARAETLCKWDIRATYDDGDTTDARDVDLCKVATVTLTAH